MYKKIAILILSILAAACGGNVDNLIPGDMAPDFTLQNHEGKSFSLSDYKGNSPVIIYFYPKANTSGCTKQACGIRDDNEKFKSQGIAVLGISVDSKEDIGKFVADHSLNFPLLSDHNKEVSEKYGVLNNLGLASRITFIINKSGEIDTIIRDVDVDSHSQQVYELAKKLI